MPTQAMCPRRRPGPPAPDHPDPAGSVQDADALLRWLYAQHGPGLLRLAARLTGGDGAHAEDLVQEVMLRAWRHRATTDFTARPPGGWLTTTLRNLAIDAYRARQARPAEAGPDAFPALASPASTDSDVDRWHVQAAIAALPPHHRQVVVEIYYRDRSVADTARMLNVPPGTVKSRLFYGLRALRRALAADNSAQAGAAGLPATSPGPFSHRAHRRRTAPHPPSPQAPHDPAATAARSPLPQPGSPR